MPKRQTLTAVAGVVVFGICGALPFYRSEGPGHTVLHDPAGGPANASSRGRPDDSVLTGNRTPSGAAGESSDSSSPDRHGIRSAQPPLRASQMIEPLPKPVVPLHRERSLLGAVTPDTTAPRHSVRGGGTSHREPSDEPGGATSRSPVARPRQALQGHVRQDGTPPPVREMQPYVRHIVRDGDSLENLAVTYLGNAAHAREIYELNRSRPGCADPNFLPIGVELFIPRRDRL